jgi:hypothetical protein
MAVHRRWAAALFQAYEGRRRLGVAQNSTQEPRATPWLPVLLAVLTLALGIILSEVKGRIGWYTLIEALGLCLVIYCLAQWMTIRTVCPISRDVVDDLKRRIDQYVEKGAYTWILTNGQLIELERRVDVDEIWLVTSDVMADIPGSPFFDVVHANLARGIRYHYFVPDSLAADARAQQLIENHRGQGDIRVTKLSEDFFFLGPRLDFAIYDPLNRKGCRCAYMQLPVETTPILHVKTDPDIVDKLIGKLQATCLSTRPQPAVHRGQTPP